MAVAAVVAVAAAVVAAVAVAAVAVAAVVAAVAAVAVAVAVAAVAAVRRVGVPVGYKAPGWECKVPVWVQVSCDPAARAATALARRCCHTPCYKKADTAFRMIDKRYAVDKSAGSHSHHMNKTNKQVGCNCKQAEKVRDSRRKPGPAEGRKASRAAWIGHNPTVNTSRRWQ